MVSKMDPAAHCTRRVVKVAFPMPRVLAFAHLPAPQIKQ